MEGLPRDKLLALMNCSLMVLLWVLVKASMLQQGYTQQTSTPACQSSVYVVWGQTRLDLKNLHEPTMKTLPNPALVSSLCPFQTTEVKLRGNSARCTFGQFHPLDQVVEEHHQVTPSVTSILVLDLSTCVHDAKQPSRQSRCKA